MAGYLGKIGIPPRSSILSPLLCRIWYFIYGISGCPNWSQRGIHVCFRLVHFLNYEQTLPSMILRQRHLKARKLRSRRTSSTSLLEDSDTHHYRSIGDTREHCGSSLAGSESTVEVLEPPPLRALLTPRVLIPAMNYGFISFCDISVQVLTPLMWSTSLKHDGLGFTLYTIGLASGIYGLANVFIQAMLLAKVIRQLGPRKAYIVYFMAFLISLLCFPLEKCLARRAGGADWRVWIVIIVHLAACSTVSVCYSELGFLRSPILNNSCQLRFRFWSKTVRHPSLLLLP